MYGIRESSDEKYLVGEKGKIQFVGQLFLNILLTLITFGKVKCALGGSGRTLMRAGLPLLHFLDEDVKHLRLDELLDEVPRGLGLDGLVEGPLLECLAGPRPATRGHKRGVVAHRFHKEGEEGFRHHPVPLLHR